MDFRGIVKGTYRDCRGSILVLIFDVLIDSNRYVCFVPEPGQNITVLRDSIGIRMQSHKFLGLWKDNEAKEQWNTFEYGW
jgi:hypothetical protein